MIESQRPSHLISFGLTILAAFVIVPACSGLDLSDGAFEGASGESDETGELGDGDPAGSDTGTDPTSTGDGDGDEGPTGDGDGEDPNNGVTCVDCGDGSCIDIGDQSFCECPEGTSWAPDRCEECPVIDPAELSLDLEFVTIAGDFLLGGAAPPFSEYDDANLWLENTLTGDRVLLGNTHEQSFTVRVTPGLYDVFYEAETATDKVPRNARAKLERLALFTDEFVIIDIPVVQISGDLLLDSNPPPVDEYDDARILLLDPDTGDEVFAGNTQFGAYAVVVVPNEYDVIYRVETPGDDIPRNDGAVLETVDLLTSMTGHTIDIASVSFEGEFLINGMPAPASEYDDANIELDSDTSGRVELGNTHDGSFAVNMIPGTYTVVYQHETGPNVPQNQHARLWSVDVEAAEPTPIDIPMVQLSGALTLNGGAPPLSEFDDGVVHFAGVDSQDSVLLGNTHDGGYQVNLLPGTYDVYYSQETSGGTVPDNKRARVAQDVVVELSASMDFNVDAVPLTGLITFAGGTPPNSAYEDGRIYLRNVETDDTVLLGNTHQGDFAAIVVPGNYDVFYVQEAGGEVPGNQNALLDSISIEAATNLELDLPVVSVSGTLVFQGGQPPNSPSDGGQIYLRNVDGDSVLLGDSFAPDYTTKLVAGTYGVYYRAEGSVTMPQNENGRFACITVE